MGWGVCFLLALWTVKCWYLKPSNFLSQLTCNKLGLESSSKCIYFWNTLKSMLQWENTFNQINIVFFLSAYERPFNLSRCMDSSTDTNKFKNPDAFFYDQIFLDFFHIHCYCCYYGCWRRVFILIGTRKSSSIFKSIAQNIFSQIFVFLCCFLFKWEKKSCLNLTREGHRQH